MKSAGHRAAASGRRFRPTAHKTLMVARQKVRCLFMPYSESMSNSPQIRELRAATGRNQMASKVLVQVSVAVLASLLVSVGLAHTAQAKPPSGYCKNGSWCPGGNFPCQVKSGAESKKYCQGLVAFTACKSGYAFDKSSGKCCSTKRGISVTCYTPSSDKE